MAMTPQQPPCRLAGWLVRGAVLALAVALLAACTPGRPDSRTQPQPGSRAQEQAPTSVQGDLAGLVLSGTSLTREGAGVTLRFTITNQGKESLAVGDLLGPGGLAPGRFEASGVYLYDGTARKRYNVVRDGDACRCATVPPSIEPGQALQLFATFPDLPGGAGQLSAIVPHFIPVHGLRIQN